jgi:hypothetical protein
LFRSVQQQFPEFAVLQLSWLPAIRQTHWRLDVPRKMLEDSDTTGGNNDDEINLRQHRIVYSDHRLTANQYLCTIVLMSPESFINPPTVGRACKTLQRPE